MKSSYMLVQTVMTSSDQVMILMWQLILNKPTEHEWNDRTGTTVPSVCITTGKNIAFQQQI